MTKDFLSLPKDHQAVLIHSAEKTLPFIDTVIEKDIWVCKLLEILFSLPYAMVFKGGTSLSKGYGLISRFSEDLDITIDHIHLREEPIKLEGATRSSLKKISNELKESLRVFSHDVLLPQIQKQLNAQLPESEFDLMVSNNGEQVRVYYPSVLNEKEAYFRDHVLLEFGARSEIEPKKICSIQPYLAGAIDEKYTFPKPNVPVLSPIRTLWEKLTLIHVECQRNRLIQSASRLSRHWYDVFMLNQSWVGSYLFDSANVLKQVIDYKKAFYNASYANYDDCLEGGFILIPEEKALVSLEADYLEMCQSGMLVDTPPTFYDIVLELTELQSKLSKTLAVTTC